MKIPFTKYALKGYNPKLEQLYALCDKENEIMAKKPFARSHIINALLNQTEQKRYLEIGVRNPEDNFNKINADLKYSVDPGLESDVNKATFPFTSDVFFEKLNRGEIELTNDKFDVIFIDGLHLADQVYKDIRNALSIIADKGFIILHDCSPPTIYHARENFDHQSPATNYWNGTSWKAYQRFRTESDKRCFVVDVDWGVGVIVNHDESSEFRLDADTNPFYEYNVMAKDRKKCLNLCTVEEVPELQSLIK